MKYRRRRGVFMGKNVASALAIVKVTSARHLGHQTASGDIDIDGIENVANARSTTRRRLCSIKNAHRDISSRAQRAYLLATLSSYQARNQRRLAYCRSDLLALISRINNHGAPAASGVVTIMYHHQVTRRKMARDVCIDIVAGMSVIALIGHQACDKLASTVTTSIWRITRWHLNNDRAISVISCGNMLSRSHNRGNVPAT